jgi:hypothetical protein
MQSPTALARVPSGSALAFVSANSASSRRRPVRAAEPKRRPGKPYVAAERARAANDGSTSRELPPDLVIVYGSRLLASTLHASTQGGDHADGKGAARTGDRTR